MSARLVGNNALTGISVNGIYVKAADQLRLEAAQFQVTNLLRLCHDIYPPESDDFSVTNQADIIQTFRLIFNSLSVMVVAIAGISLVVGGIGIANIMLVSVVERTREIGVRKALGATQAAILSQFLAEAILISTIGGRDWHCQRGWLCGDNCNRLQVSTRDLSGIDCGRIWTFRCNGAVGRGHSRSQCSSA
jgi:putative ABC transport system permease protein